MTGNMAKLLSAFSLTILFALGLGAALLQKQSAAETAAPIAPAESLRTTQPVAAATTTLPIVPTAGDMRLTVGAVVNFPPNVYNRDYFGCYDIENTKKGYRLYTAAVDAAAKKGAAEPELFGVAAVERFVWAHHYDHLPPDPNKPDFYTDVCWAMKPFTKMDNAHIVRAIAEWDGVGQVACLGPALDASAVSLEFAERRKAEAEKRAPDKAAMTPKRPFCFWTILSMPPTLSR